MPIKAKVGRLGRWNLWRKIENFNFDRYSYPGAFNRKLATEHRWTVEFTEKVIEEYRRFLFLAAISDSEVTPSKLVDEAWHLHLTWSQSYWDDLCGNVLKRALHHHPGSGEKSEEKKYSAQYAATLAFYSEMFDLAAPEDIWGRAPAVESPNLGRENASKARSSDAAAQSGSNDSLLAATCGASGITSTSTPAKSAGTSDGAGHGGSHGGSHGDGHGGSHGASHCGSHGGSDGGASHCGGASCSSASCGGASCGGGGCGGN